jgi:hypothetical protein
MVDIERERLIKAAVAAAGGRFPVIVGTSHKGTIATGTLSRMAESLGAGAVMVTPSREPVPNEDRVFEYFRQAVQGISIPVVVQDHPASTEVHMSVELMLRIVREIPGVACIKEEAPPTPARIAALIRGMTSRKVPILTGLGALYGMFDLECGSAGFMTGFAFPEVLIALVRAVRENGWAMRGISTNGFSPDRVRTTAGRGRPEGDPPDAGTDRDRAGAASRCRPEPRRGFAASGAPGPNASGGGPDQAAGALNGRGSMRAGKRGNA